MPKTFPSIPLTPHGRNDVLNAPPNLNIGNTIKSLLFFDAGNYIWFI